MRKIVTLSALFMLLIQPATAQKEEGWKEHRSSHFIVYYRDSPFDFVESVIEMAEQYYEEITENLGFTRYHGWTFDKRAKIYIYDDQEDYVTNARLMRWSHGATSARRKEIWTFPTAHGFFDSTLPHELGHIIFREFVGFVAPIPPWMDEGVAMYQEKAKRWGANKIVKQALENGTFIPLSDLGMMRLTSSSSKQLVDLYYAESASIVYYLITEHGKNRFVRFCRELKKGQRYDFALPKVYMRFKNIDKLNESWVEYLNEQ